MIRKLQKQFVKLALAIIGSALLIIILVVAIIGMNNITSGADAYIQQVYNDGGQMKEERYDRKKNEPAEPADEPTDEPADDLNDNPADEDTSILSRIGRLGSTDLHYFTVIDSDDTQTLFYSNAHEIDEISDASDYIEDALADGSDSGYTDSYRYGVFTDDDGTTMIIFVNCDRNLETYTNTLKYFFFVSIACILFFWFFFTMISSRLIRPISESYEKQKQFITDAGHELKTPLTAIAADAAILEMDLEENEWVQDIQYQTNRLSDLTKDLIYLSKMDEGNLDQTKTEFSLSEITEEILEHSQARLITENKQLTLEIAPDIRMTGTESEIRRLITLLLDNAIKYSDQQGLIQVHLSADSKNIKLTFYNTCETLVKNETKNAFDRFYRGDNSRSNHRKGYGLGLSIARSIVERHGGSITATTENGHSWQVNVRFPL